MWKLNPDSRPQLMVFTDLDGTLLDHNTYRWDAAKPALELLKHRGAIIVLASSKTYSEIRFLQNEIGLGSSPAIVENGAGVIGVGRVDFSDELYRSVRKALNQIETDLRSLYVGFGDMSVNTVAQITGLTHTQAKMAKERAFSEPGIWKGDEQQREKFLSSWAAMGFAAQQGGRFLTLSKGGSKAEALNTVREHFQPDHTIALGDAPNDIEMLEAADYSAIIANPHKPSLPTLNGEDSGRIIRSALPGPKGWAKSVEELLARLSIL